MSLKVNNQGKTGQNVAFQAVSVKIERGNNRDAGSAGQAVQAGLVLWLTCLFISLALTGPMKDR